MTSALIPPATGIDVPYVILPWPPSILYPSAQVFWTKKANAAEDYKRACWVLAKQAHLKLPETPCINVLLEFFPPGKRLFGDVNCIDAFKAGRDGVAMALGVDATLFRTTTEIKQKIGGYVKFSIFV